MQKITRIHLSGRSDHQGKVIVKNCETVELLCIDEKKAAAMRAGSGFDVVQPYY
jgi:hypothetical protein